MCDSGTSDEIDNDVDRFSGRESSAMVIGNEKGSVGSVMKPNGSLRLDCFLFSVKNVIGLRQACYGLRVVCGCDCGFEILLPTFAVCSQCASSEVKWALIVDGYDFLSGFLR